MLHIPSLYIAPSQLAGKGVFSFESIEDESTIEVCPVIILPESEVADMVKTNLYNYYFEWGPGDKQAVVALGYGSLYNHSYEPNARYYIDEENETISIVAIKAILAHEEILINYNGEPSDKKKVWFDK